MQPQKKKTMQEKPKSFYKKPTLVLLPYKGGQRWYICLGRNKERTAFEAHQKADAQLAAAARQEDVQSPTAGNMTPVTEVMDWASALPRYKNQRCAGFVALLAVKRVCDLSQDALNAAILVRQTHTHPKTGEPIAESTAWTEAGRVMTMVRSHARENALPRPAAFAKKVSSPHQNERALTRTETARLLWACLEYKWDAALLRMVPHDKRMRKRLRRLRAPVRRLLLLGLYAGTSVATGVALVWDATPNGTQSHVDVAEGRLLRLGAQAPRTANLKDVPVALSRRMMAHARRWRRHDASDIRHIVHVTAKGKYNRGLADTRFREICDDAGLPGVTFSMIVTTHAAMALREGASVRALAIALGLSGDAVNRRYKHFSRSFQEGAGKAFRQRPKSIR